MGLPTKSRWFPLCQTGYVFGIPPSTQAILLFLAIARALLAIGYGCNLGLFANQDQKPSNDKHGGEKGPEEILSARTGSMGNFHGRCKTHEAVFLTVTVEALISMICTTGGEYVCTRRNSTPARHYRRVYLDIEILRFDLSRTAGSAEITFTTDWKSTSCRCEKGAEKRSFEEWRSQGKNSRIE